MGLVMKETEVGDEIERVPHPFGPVTMSGGDAVAAVLAELQLDNPAVVDRVEIFTDPVNNATGAIVDVQVENPAGTFVTIASLQITVPTTGRSRVRAVATGADTKQQVVADVSATSGGRVRLVVNTAPTGGTSAKFHATAWINYGKAARANA